MAARELVSVIVPVYNGERFILSALRSAFAQTYEPLEVIVVDDGSERPVAPFLEEFGGSIHLVQTPNRGVAAARNRGIRESKGAFVALLDQDDVWMPEKLERQLVLFANDGDLGLVHSDVVYRDELADRTYTRKRPRRELSGHCYGRLFMANAISAATTVFRRAAGEAVGWFDETIKGTDDYDFELRLARRFRFGYVDEPLVMYRVHDQNWSHRQLAMLENELLVVDKALAADPGLPAIVGVDGSRQRLAGLLTAVGYGHFQSGALARARPYLRRALTLKPEATTALWWCSTYLPDPVVTGLRTLRQRIIPHRRERRYA